MSSGLPNETSVFEKRSLDDIIGEIQDVYKRYPQPWVIGYSGGKDSTAVLQLIWIAMERLDPEDRAKPIFVIASDTKVETPVIVDYIDNTIHQINSAAANTDLPFQATKVTPKLTESFWVNLIGRGYPAPTSRFRWCTERMKINPADRFIEDKVAKFGEVILVLGVRRTESATRMQLMNTYQVGDHVLRRHTSLRGAYVYAPIADFSADDVWSFLLANPTSPWGGNNRDLAALYRNANAGECPLVIDTSTPSCGNSRFGCWVCTVVERDTSMEALIDHGEEWMQPLLEFRDFLATTTIPDRKREFRDIKGRDGRILLKKDGTAAARGYKLDVSRQMLKELLSIQHKIRADGPDPDVELISEDELHEIRRIWRIERQDWDDSVPAIYIETAGNEIEWPQDDDGAFDTSDKALLESVCKEYDAPFDLVAKMLERERQFHGMARRSGIQKALSAALSEEWRSESEVIEAAEQVALQFPPGGQSAQGPSR